jgi:2-hydroxychromene-2-carboxylate isomerase
LLPTALVLGLVLAGFMIDRPGDLAAAETAKSEPGAPGAAETAPPAAPVAPATPQAAPATPPAAPSAATPPAAPGTPPLAAPTAPEAPATAPAAPAKTKKAAKGKKAAKQPKWQQAAPPGKIASPGKYNAGEDPEFAQRHGWPVKTPPTLPGSILPGKRIVAYYGNPLSKKMGALGEYPKDEMLRRLKGEVAKWEAADPSLPVQPALHLVAVTAQGEAGKAGKYRMIMPDKIINQVYDWAKEANAILFIDIQTGHSDIRTILPRFEWLLKNPDVHLGMDPEFNMLKSGKKPGTKIGTYDAADINYAAGYLQELVKKHNLPPKVFVVHRFTRNMVTNANKIALRPEVQIVMNMDGWGAPWLKRDSYQDYIVAEPVEYTGFKLFYHNDTKKGDPLMTPHEVLKLNPKPIYIQYQ